ncbi:thioredoxin domain-containing protein [Corynebacterium pygosceleis]|uniref:DUF255 domain-containing protein n=1 Tax=Corynebacterium pygosceleis TaxID=2800406 RepID=A0A9Q4C7B4_9CORY|nr:DUF255 domain-containing protein [Corynebacterium pygosceleis]MCK7637049.1 DUF255 domain-containing protein [Corynebacterium pygosceleis]MCL0120179.1 DUF255 domain-containing protein [Corynebacterium pygosceleis]MCX7443723.1 DUF255 domain-containing protein [Corynebacterium pygosceleis]MCX7467802.1 DUF255 domain-containing protein [Corynebacterium pygosceleis]
MVNRLSDSDSTYLLQHAGDPVDWWPFCPEAFAEAGRRDVPVLVSIGYAACHWCHVMARESFSDPEIADLMNRHLVCVKVDREQHPDIDALYMQATIALSGHGGWPMTVFTDPEGRPFHADTYVPPADRQGRPGMPRLIRAVAETWRSRRGEVADMGAKVRAMMELHTAPVRPVPSDTGVLDRIVSALADAEDLRNGGFGGAPKFPPSATLLGLTRRAERTGDGSTHALVGRTIEAMLRGGIFDQIAGGFARYTVDAAWRTPHFEKMLDDNALLLRALSAHATPRGIRWRPGRRSRRRSSSSRISAVTTDCSRPPWTRTPTGSRERPTCTRDSGSPRLSARIPPGTPTGSVPCSVWTTPRSPEAGPCPRCTVNPRTPRGSSVSDVASPPPAHGTRNPDATRPRPRRVRRWRRQH